VISQIAFVAAAVLPASTNVDWLNIHGDPTVPAVNTIQVDPKATEVRGMVRVLRVRVSRSLPRTSWDGVPYRSYDSLVSVDCKQRTAKYQTIRYFVEPLWKGPASKTVDYTTGEPRWMLFKDVEPNPNQRILNAACTPVMAVR
jgi:hypothetical protein